MPDRRERSRTPRSATRWAELAVISAMPSDPLMVAPFPDGLLVVPVPPLEHLAGEVAQGDQMFDLGRELRGVEVKLDPLHQAQPRPELGGQRRPRLCPPVFRTRRN